MTIKEKLQFFSDNGMSVKFIADQMNVNVSTLTRWLHNEKGITHKNEDLVLLTLKKIVNNFTTILED